MVRPSQLLYPAQEAAPPRPAATMLLLRDAPEGLEVLMTRRSDSANFAAGAYVFPGGAIDAADHESHALASHRPGQTGFLLTQAIAAIRESYEELGILLARHADGRMAGAADIAALDRAPPAGETFASQCAARGLRLAADELRFLARWIADRNNPRRFDTAFFAARMPADQEPVADDTEQFEPVWVRPAAAIERHKAGRFLMLFPTIRTLERLSAYPDVDAVLTACAGEDPLTHNATRAGLVAGVQTRFTDEEAPYGELALVCPDGQIVHALEWQHERPVPLLRNVMRLTSGNPGVMTGPGTNSYLVGDPDTGYIAIDPGPDDPQHLERLWRAAGGDIRMIVCTHSHSDHSPGAAPLKALCRDAPPILGLPSADTARPDSRFTPERALADGETLVLQGAGRTHTLRVITTPGHAANHLCLALLEDGLLFSGDHVLNGSTTIVNPPDGDMSDYLDSLDKLDAACVDHDLRFILPAHGHVLGQARAAIARLKEHRLRREAKVAAAMRRLPAGTPDDWVRLAYDDVPERMWPIAARSLLAHVQRIESRGVFNDD